ADRTFHALGTAFRSRTGASGVPGREVLAMSSSPWPVGGGCGNRCHEAVGPTEREVRARVVVAAQLCDIQTPARIAAVPMDNRSPGVYEGPKLVDKSRSL